MTTSTVKAERQHTEASKPEIDNDNFNLAKKSSENLFKILCVGDFSGGWSKGVYIEDYLRSDGTTCENAIEKPVIGFSLSLRTVTCKRSGEKIRLHMWNIAEQERFSTISKIYYKMADGALVFWGAKSRSFESAIKWKANVSQTLQLDIPFVLVVDNVFKTPAKWIGQGLVINSPRRNGPVLSGAWVFGVVRDVGTCWWRGQCFRTSHEHAHR